MKNVYWKSMEVFLALISVSSVACTNRTGFEVGRIESPKTEAPVPSTEKTVAALNAMQSVTIVTCANGKQGLRVVTQDGQTADVACGGLDGAQGATGLTGAAGPQGPQGVQGVQGPAGSGKRFVAYNNDGTLTGLVFLYQGEGHIGTFYHEPSGYIVQYKIGNGSATNNEYVGLLNSGSEPAILYAATNCTGQGYASVNAGRVLANTIFKRANKWWKTSLSTTFTDNITYFGSLLDVDGTCRTSGIGNTPTGSELAVSFVSNSIPVGIPEAVKPPLKIVLE